MNGGYTAKMLIFFQFLFHNGKDESLLSDSEMLQGYKGITKDPELPVLTVFTDIDKFHSH